MKTAKAPLSVIVPVYNGERYLGEALESVFTQSRRPGEIIVVDDGSGDASGGIARTFPGVSLIIQSHAGVAAARNRGIRRARLEYLAFLDADDRWMPEKVDLQMGFLMDRSDIDAVFGWLENYVQPGIRIPPHVNEEVLLAPQAGKMPSLGTMVIRREAMTKVGNFNPSLQTGSDLDWLFRMRERGLRTEMLSRVLLRRRLHQSNLIYRLSDRKADMIKLVRRSIKRK